MPTGTITAIAAQAQDSQRVNIFIDSQFVIGIGLATLAQEGLFVGQHLDADGWARLEVAAQSEAAMRAALRLLDSRPRSVAEVRRQLARKHYPAEIVAQAVARMQELGLLDDAAFSNLWVESRQRVRPRGPHALRDELRRKGVDRATIDDTLATHAGDSRTEAVQVEAVARAALPRYADCPDWASFQRRLGGLLQRRGFHLDLISPILGILWRELRQRADES